MPDFVDLTHRLDSDIAVYPGDPPFSSCPHLTLSADGVNVARLTFGSHAGTHVDAPIHFVADGKKIDEIPPETFVGPAVVVDLTAQRELCDREEVQWADLALCEDALKARPGAILLLRTGWSRYWGTPRYFEHPFLSAEAARRIVATGVRLVGVDTLSPDETVLDEAAAAQHEYAFHKVVLGAGIVIAENLTGLDAIQDGEWVVSLLPLKLGGCDGSPVRAVAWRQGEL
ncbi:cyclase family protein [Phanerochaete sordida]|uniref:Cyclase family protein n=1 Tax=Phanerochaete sordida TaxID=48140 RepID=A0A9P3GH13_9APHY|nr:cyclase family protein [Phanerochaete sordida]